MKVVLKSNYGIIEIVIIIILLSISSGYLAKSSQEGCQTEHIPFNSPENTLRNSAQSSTTKQWLKNPTLDEPLENTWFTETTEDHSDVSATYEQDHVNLNVIGDSGIYEMSGTPNSSSSLNNQGWYEFNNTIFILPDDAHEITQNGCMAAHTYDEVEDQSRNRVSIHWRKNVSLPVDMSDYIITSASLESIVNGTADQNLETPSDTFSGFSTFFDYAKFYVKFSNIEYLEYYEVAFNKTVDLGTGNVARRSEGNLDEMPDTNMTVIEQDKLIFYLNKVLEHDNYNFGITLGIDIYCEDNYNQADLDIFYSLYIKTLNFSFTYEKMVDRLTTVSWIQECDAISTQNVQINNAKLFFEYKINQNWITSSPNSEIRILVNDNKNTEAVILADYAYSDLFQAAKEGGFDITQLIPPNGKFNFSVQLYLADKFNLDRNIVISLDNFSLILSYTIFYSDYSTELNLFLNNINKTVERSLEVPLDERINISVKYTDFQGNHIEGASVSLTSENYVLNFIENKTLSHYSLLLNSTENLRIKVNQLTITAQKENYMSSTIQFQIIVRKFNTIIATLSGGNQINLKPGENMELKILLQNEDYSERIYNATVTYSWEFGQGILADQDGDGVYEAIISNVPEGSFIVVIDAYINNRYNFERYEIILSVGRPIEELILFQLMSTLGVLITISLIGYFIVYYRILKYPKSVRNCRKFKKYIGKKKIPSLILPSRKDAIDEIYKEKLYEIFPKLETKTINTEIGKNKTKFFKKFNNTFKSIKIKRVLPGLLIIYLIFFTAFLSIPFLVLRWKDDGFTPQITHNPIEPLINELPESAGVNSYTEQWIKNPTFGESSDNEWVSLVNGDSLDIVSNINQSQAKNNIIGDVKTFSEISGTPQDGDWIQFDHAVRPLPLTHEINEFGCSVSHTFDEEGDQTANLVGVLWKRNFTMPVDMSDYTITSANLVSIINGTADTNIETPNDVLSDPQDYYGSLFDFARFYIVISDLEDIESFQIAENKTRYLGEGNQNRRGSGTPNDMNDTNMTTVDEDILIYALTEVLKHDNRNFTVSLGIEIDCEDNYYHYELDIWDSLLIKSVNLTFTYEKTINKLTEASWNQECNAICGENIQILNAKLFFQYRLDRNWTELSPNSEIQILIDNKKHKETVKLIDYIYSPSLQDANTIGFDITSLIPYNKTFIFAIRVFLADNFKLDKNITLSIDNVYLYITYELSFEDYDSKIELLLNGEKRTSDPVIEVPVGENVNITVKYNDNSGKHIQGANIELVGENLFINLKENRNLGHYSIVLNSTESLRMEANILTITADKANYKPKTITPRVTVRKLNATISSISETSKIDTRPGENIELKVNISDEDYGGLIQNAIVTYSWEFGQGILTDQNGDGIYEGTISKIPEGTYTITIKAIAGDEFAIENYEFIISSIRPAEEIAIFQILTILGICTALFVGGTIFIYQKILKYPKAIRRLHKFKKALVSKKMINIEVNSKQSQLAGSYGELLQESVDFLEETIQKFLIIKKINP